MTYPNDILLGTPHPGREALPVVLPSPEEAGLEPVRVARGREVYTNPALRGSKQPYPHRFHLDDGSILDAEMYREPNSRLVDDLYGTKGDFICVLNARGRRAGEAVAFMVINLRHIVSIEEL